MKGDLDLVVGVYESFQASNQKMIRVAMTKKIADKENGANTLLYVPLLWIY